MSIAGEIILAALAYGSVWAILASLWLVVELWRRERTWRRRDLRARYEIDLIKARARRWRPWLQ